MHLCITNEPSTVKHHARARASKVARVRCTLPPRHGGKSERKKHVPLLRYTANERRPRLNTGSACAQSRLGCSDQIRPPQTEVQANVSRPLSETIISPSTYRLHPTRCLPTSHQRIWEAGAPHTPPLQLLVSLRQCTFEFSRCQATQRTPADACRACREAVRVFVVTHCRAKGALPTAAAAAAQARCALTCCRCG